MAVSSFPQSAEWSTSSSDLSSTDEPQEVRSPLYLPLAVMVLVRGAISRLRCARRGPP
jgi:hypothetical protein